MILTFFILVHNLNCLWVSAIHFTSDNLIRLKSIMMLGLCSRADRKLFSIVRPLFPLGDLISHSFLFNIMSGFLIPFVWLGVINSTSFPFRAKIFATASSWDSIKISGGMIILPCFIQKIIPRTTWGWLLFFTCLKLALNRTILSEWKNKFRTQAFHSPKNSGRRRLMILSAKNIFLAKGRF